MNLTGILPALLADPAAAAAVEHVRARGEADVVGPAGARPPLLAAMAGARATGPVEGTASDGTVGGAAWAPGSRPLVVVTATGRDADELAASVRVYLPDELWHVFHPVHRVRTWYLLVKGG